MYRYLSIRSGPKYSKSVAAMDVDAFLGGRPELKRKAALSYENNTEFPWLQVLAVFGDENGNYAMDVTRQPNTVNQIELICSIDGSDAAVHAYYTLAQKIAAKFEWEVFDSEFEGGI
ncbi:MAG: hypothetical protein ABJN69_08030 [Hellea sp.]